MKKLIIGLALLALMSCSLFSPNPFIGTWQADMEWLTEIKGDYMRLDFNKDMIVTDSGRYYGTPYSESGSYDFDPDHQMLYLYYKSGNYYAPYEVNGTLKIFGVIFYPIS